MNECDQSLKPEDTALCQRILSHVNFTINQILSAYPLYNTSSNTTTTTTTTRTTYVIGVIKGKVLLENGDLGQFLKYHATQYYINEYDRVSATHPYPPNNTLLAQAIWYNNPQVFDHLLRNVNMSLPAQTQTDQSNINKSYSDLITKLVKIGNLHMLQSYLSMTAHSMITGITGEHLLMAINHDNEDFVRLLLQHTIVNESNNGQAPRQAFALTLPGISLSMLRLVHQEFGHNLNDQYVWHAVVKQCVLFNNAESVKYLFDRIPASFTAGLEFAKLLNDYLILCVSSGHIDTFKVLVPHLKSINFRVNFAVLAANGHAEFAKFIMAQHRNLASLTSLFIPDSLLQAALVGGHLNMVELLLDVMTGKEFNIPIQVVTDIHESIVSESLITRLDNHQNVKSLIDLAEFKANGMIVTPRSLINKLFDAIERNDLQAARLVLPRCNKLPLKSGDIKDDYAELWTSMSVEMGMLIGSQTHKPLLLHRRDLSYMIQAIQNQDYKMTEAVVSTFIANNHFDLGFEVQGNFKPYMSAGGVSLAFMKQLNQTYYLEHLLNAIRRDCVENIIYLAKKVKPKNGEDKKVIGFAVQQALYSGTLETIQAIAKHMKADKSSKKQSFAYDLDTWQNTEQAIRNPDHRVFELIFDSLDYSRSFYFDKFFISACRGDKPLVLKKLLEVGYTLTLQAYELAASFNSHLIMAYLLANWPAHLSTNVQPIKELNKPDKKRKLSGTLDVDMVDATTAPRLTTLFHTLFRDRRLGMIVLGQVGYIYKRLGAKDGQLIKGKQLLARDTLTTYINYGAVDWFHKAYRPLANTYPINSQLLKIAIISANRLILDTLIDNPKMTLESLDTNHLAFLEKFLKRHTDCTQPDWEYSFDVLLANIGRANLPKYTVETLHIRIHHPALMRKFLAMSDLPLHPSDFINDILHSHDAGGNADADAGNGIGQEPLTIPFFGQNIKIPEGPLTNDTMFEVSKETHDLLMKLQNQSLGDMYTFMQSQPDLMAQSFNMIQQLSQAQSKSNQQLERFCMSGYTAKVDEILAKTHASKLSPDSLLRAYRAAAINGRLDIVKKLFAVITPLDWAEDFNPCQSIECVLENGYLDVATFMLDQPVVADDEDEDNEDDDNDDPVIMDIHPSILTIGLLRRLVAHPRLNCLFAKVLAGAILNRDKTVINYLEFNEQGVFGTDYCAALGAAASIGDVMTANMILGGHPTVCLPLEYIDDPVKPAELHQLHLMYDDYDTSESDEYEGNQIDLEQEDQDRVKRHARYASVWARAHPDVCMAIAARVGTGNMEFGVKYLCRIIESHYLPETKMSEKVVRAFIQNWLSIGQTDQSIINVIKCAATHSHSMVRLVQDIFKTPQQQLLFTQAIPECAKRADAESIKFILDVARAASTATNTPLNLDKLASELGTITNVHVLAVLIEYDIIKQTQKINFLILRLLDNACATGHVDTIRFIDQRFNKRLESPTSIGQHQWQLVPSLQAIVSAAMTNHYDVIVHLFSSPASESTASSSFWSTMSQHPAQAIRLLVQLRDAAFVDGHIKLISWITNRIKQLE
ncbi:hypothetical protein SAMD00019534_113750 [Acytostelium subglobosum LB1]|uniref:hypothetical protein n=1 Tax=Acytostelium subglobosum LB1 TaxID=1410327 RepID=UPI000644DB5E|nr:hypothetical protein SAMD00019534_113750 [Acytostelium subglobosum LB1]GAM28199.1 hypothetical protein SAMD00019534_113750 [Acytostelium subglobosum LB1]|eukprot:XP_012748833.1 hypothetical protein SAMD00019534_113750 [Acytostelium subglobosum LB1]